MTLVLSGRVFERSLSLRIRDGAIQKKLLSVVDLTSKRASEIALAMEIADKNTQDFKQKTFSEDKNISRETTRKANLTIKIGLKIKMKDLDVFVVREVMHQIYANSRMRYAINV